MVEFITHHDLPTVLYKYYAPPSPKIQYSEENLKTLLRAGKIRLTNGLEVNDLFECDPYVVWDDVTPDVTYQYAKWLWESNDPQTADPRTALRKTYPTLCSLREAKPKLYQDVTTDKETTTQNTLKVMSFCCLTAVSDSILMWAHYAADHYGVCIGFSTKYFQFPAAALPIDYEQKRPCMSAKDNFFNTSRGEKFKCEVFKTLRTKSEHWNYEKEWRFFGTDIHTHEVYKAGHLFVFERQAISEIIFGARATDDTIEKIKSMVSDMKPKPKLLKAKKSQSRYELEIAQLQ